MKLTFIFCHGVISSNFIEIYYVNLLQTSLLLVRLANVKAHLIEVGPIAHIMAYF